MINPKLIIDAIHLVKVVHVLARSGSVVGEVEDLLELRNQLTRSGAHPSLIKNATHWIENAQNGVSNPGAGKWVYRVRKAGNGHLNIKCSHPNRV